MVDPGQDVPPATSFGEACASIARVVAESLDLDQVIAPIGAGPKTDSLDKVVQRDEKGHILTGRHVDRDAAGDSGPLDRGLSREGVRDPS